MACVCANTLRMCISVASVVYWLFTTSILVPSVCVFYLCVLAWPIKPFSYMFGVRLKQFLCRRVNDHWVAQFNAFGFSLREYGIDIGTLSEDRCFLIANHVALLDHFILMASFQDKGSISRKYMWLIFHVWKWTPLGIMWHFHGNFFINGGGRQRELGLAAFKRHLAKWYWTNDYGWVVVYPEGSRLYKIRESSKRYAEKLGAPSLEHLALPRVGAFKTVLQACGPQSQRNGFKQSGKGDRISRIIDATIGYKDGVAPSLWEASFEPSFTSAVYSKQVAVHYRSFDVSTIDVSSEEALQNWLNDRWVEKDRLLHEFYKTGHFPGERPKMPRSYDIARLVLAELFWLASFYAHLTCWVIPLCKWFVSFLCA